ncbi:MAG: AtpZ/AtpI family protein [Lachnospiraceae bacterium]|nr:AtpZ/AtpI family protein [Lachnospiraceae bacterium]MBR4173766.1 AtpZ/AtpI family protein [Lachnospiraceae bacterium]
MNKDNKSVLKALTMVSQFGINMVVPIVICVFIGIKADQFFHTSFIVIILFFLGAAAGFRNIFIMSKDIYGSDTRKRKH